MRKKSRPAAAAPAQAAADPAPFVLQGEWTVVQAAGNRPALLAAIEAGTTRLDLSRVEEFDSAGLQLLLAARRSAVQRGSSLALEDPSAAVRALCAAYHLDEQFQPRGAR